ncbi:MAG: type II secretion system protein F [Candidatus Parcubacteria bacterium]|nr:MAG: type II secretion system protein F [Candidatus Parcubacteria bacterium]
MARFSYTARRPDGSTFDGTFEGPDRFALFEEIRAQGAVLVFFTEERNVLKRVWDWLDARLSTIREVEKIRFTKDLAAMLRAGLSLTRALSVVERQSRNKAFRRFITDLRDKVRAGSSFHDALQAYEKALSPLVVAMVRAGEESGQLPQALEAAGLQLERIYYLKKKIKGAMLYPTIILTALVAIGVLMLVYIVPTLQQTFEELGVDLPASTKFVLALSDFLRTQGLLAALLVLAVVGGIWALARTPQGGRALAWGILHIPLIGSLVKETNTARTARTLASLLEAGVPVSDAFRITADVVQNPLYREVLFKGKELIERGEPIAQLFAVRDNLYPPLMGELVAVGEETGALPEMLRQVADFYETDVDQRTKDMSTIIEPFLMVVVGIAVGFFAISMITPIYSVTEGI